MAPRNDILDHRILSLTPTDDVSIGTMAEGTLICASSGSGKTSTVGRAHALGLLKTPMSGGLVLCAKGEETQTWISYAKMCGRENDLIVFNAQSGHCFDPLFYEFHSTGGDAEAIIELFSTLLSIGKQHIGANTDRFWELAVEQLVRNVLVLLSLSGERVSIVNIHRVIQSLPSRPDEHEESNWQEESFCAQLINAIRARKDSLTEAQWSDLDYATQFVCRKWPAFDEKPRSSIEMTWSGMGDKFLFNPFNRLFCSGRCTFTPEQTTHDGKIILCDFPMLKYGQETGRLINILLKLCFQRAWLRRDIADSGNVCFLWQDEFQYFVTPKADNLFSTTCRGSRIAVVCLTQNILNLAEALGEQQPGAKTKSFLANLGTRYFMQQNCPDSCDYAASVIGREYRFIENFSSSGQTGNNASVGGSMQLVHIVEPAEFTRLLRPDADSPYAEAIVYQSGKVFNATKTAKDPRGKNYLRVLFSRET